MHPLRREKISHTLFDRRVNIGWVILINRTAKPNLFLRRGIKRVAHSLINMREDATVCMPTHEEKQVPNIRSILGRSQVTYPSHVTHTGSLMTKHTSSMIQMLALLVARRLETTKG